MLSKKQGYLILLVIAIIGTLVAYFQSSPQKRDDKKSPAIVNNGELKEEFFVMGTVFECNFFGQDQTKLEEARGIVLAELKKIEKLCNIFDAQSEIYRLNSQAHVKPFKCSDELWAILKKSRWAYRESNGNFDITAKPLMDLWGFYKKQDKLPSNEEIANALKLVGLNKVQFDDKNQTVFFPERGFSFDLGGIAKGTAVDNALGAIKSLKLDGALINLGGNISCFGKVAKHETYTVAIRHPMNKNEIAKIIKLQNESVATSGNYERFVVINGKQYAHIMNVKTGKPVENVLGVTIVAPKAEDADIFSTAVFIEGEDFAQKLVEKYPQIRIYMFLFVDGNKMLYKEFKNNLSEVKK